MSKITENANLEAINEEYDNVEYLINKYDKSNKKNFLIIVVSLILTFILGIYFSTLGVNNSTFSEVIITIKKMICGEDLVTSEQIIWYLRLPRIIMAVIAGVGLAISGSAMQGITRNPLVSPFTIGVSNAAAFGASLAIVFGIGIMPNTDFGVVATAFAFALLCTFIVYFVSSGSGMTPQTIILAGIAINYLFSAATSVIQYFATEYQLAQAIDWAFGSFNGAQWSEIVIMTIMVSISAVVLYFYSPALNVLAMGDDELAKSLGVNAGKVRMVVGFFSVFATSAVISFTGVIGFVGLAGPHIARMLTGSNHRMLLPFSAIVGALLMLVSDTIGRLILAPVIIPVGIVISFLGVPIFINLILSQRGEFKK